MKLGLGGTELKLEENIEGYLPENDHVTTKGGCRRKCHMKHARRQLVRQLTVQVKVRRTLEGISSSADLLNDRLRHWPLVLLTLGPLRGRLYDAHC